jgi:hypothetical protein
VAGALRPLGPDALPEIPDGAVPPAAEPAEPPARPEPAGRPEPAPAAEVSEPAPYAAAPTRRARPSSRLGGALLLGAAAALVAVILVLLLTGGSGDHKKAATSTGSTARGSSATVPVAQINLTSPGGNTRQVGLAQVFRMGNRRAIIAAGQGVPPGAYALWLYNSRSDSRLLGFVPRPVRRDGRFATQGALPADAGRFARLVVSREHITRQTRSAPSHPGTIVLQGDLKLG